MMTRPTTLSERPLVALGHPLPPNTPHAVSVSLPTWSDNVGYEEGRESVVAAMRSGYPRFVFNPLAKKLFAYCENRFANPTESCLIFSARIHAQDTRSYIHRHAASVDKSAATDTTPPRVRLVELMLTPQSHLHRWPDEVPGPIDESFDRTVTHPILYIIVFPSTLASIAKQFWQHTGEGISSRFAEYCLRVLEITDFIPLSPSNPDKQLALSNGHSSRYSSGPHSSGVLKSFIDTLKKMSVSHEISMFVEERFGRNLDVRLATVAKTALRRRIAGHIGDSDASPKQSPVHDTNSPLYLNGLSLGNEMVAQCLNDNQGDLASATEISATTSLPLDRGVPSLTENDVYLFPCGMSAIYNIHRVVLRIRPGLKSVQFGFPYIDTLKIQERFGPGCHFLGHGDQADLAALESLLATESISAVFCEFPSNPLLRCPDLARLSQLTRAHGCILIIDETIGNFSNVSVLPYADVVVSSLTKVFSGDSNVMGGSAILNPRSGATYNALCTAMRDLYIDTLWCEDAIFLERNSRSFAHRSKRINKNAETLCDYLITHPKVKTVLYPKFTDPQTYRVVSRDVDHPGYGGLFSLVMHTDADAIRFFDAVRIYKGPSLGTNFTLACPYTILAHYTELDWAAVFDVPSRLIRISVGTEDSQLLHGIFRDALDSL